MLRQEHLPIKRGLLYRPRVAALLEKCLIFPITSIVAGPGYGKTTSVAAFAKNFEGCVVWLHLTELDNEIQYFWYSFIAAMRQELQEIADAMKAMGFPNTLSDFVHLVQVVSPEEHYDRPTIFIVDNFDVLTNPIVLQFLYRYVQFTERLPNFHTIYISNKRLDVSINPLANVNMVGQCYHITTRDLAFTNEETAKLFSDYGKILSPEESGRITQEAEGWPIALFLQCTDEERYCPASLLSDMLEKQYYLNYAPQTRQLLIMLSSLHHFTAPIVNRLSEGNGTAVMELINLNIFIYYDHDAQRYHFQSSYKKLLESKLVFLPEERIKWAKKIAAQCFFDQGQYAEARDLFFQVQEYSPFLACLEYLSTQYDGASQTNMVITYLEQVPEDFARDNPQIEMYRALCYLNGAKLNAARSILLNLLQKLDVEDPGQRSIYGESSFILANISVLQCRMDGMEHIQNAVKYMPNGSLIQTKGTLGVGENPVFFLPDSKAGSLDATVEYIHEFGSYREKISNGSMHGYDMLFAAEAALHQLNTKQASAQALEALYKAEYMEQHDIVLKLYFVLMKTAFLEGSYQKMRHWLTEAESYYSRIQTMHETMAILRIWFSLKIKDYSGVAKGKSPYDPNTKNERPLWEGLNLFSHCIFLLHRNDRPQVLYSLSLLDSTMDGNSSWMMRLYSNLLHSAVYAMEDDTQKSMDAFYAAYEATHNNGIWFPFLELGNWIPPLLALAQRSTGYGFDEKWLTELYKRLNTAQGLNKRIIDDYQQQTKRPFIYSTQLTSREIEVLALVKDGYKNDEIASQVNISVEGVKKRLNNIYVKMGAKNRTDAVHIAMKNGLITEYSPM